MRDAALTSCPPVPACTRHTVNAIHSWPPCGGPLTQGITHDHQLCSPRRGGRGRTRGRCRAGPVDSGAGAGRRRGPGLSGNDQCR
ncbi:hypothetical protein AN916_12760, partial [Mycobacteroides immunogenum]